MQTQEVLQLIDTEYARYEEALGQISRQRMTNPGTDGGWSAKDIVAHVIWSEREMVGVLRQRALVGSEHWALAQDERNAAVYAENRDRSLDDVLEDARVTHAAVRAEIAKLTDDEMNDTKLIAQLPMELPPWRLLAGNTWQHYAEHLPMLQALA